LGEYAKSNWVLKCRSEGERGAMSWLLETFSLKICDVKFQLSYL
jgi:hypothetical protein